ncbi:DUF1735 domain-containing protein [Bacteroides caecigallinarum]|uniref:DUF5627 domain-containing protein n=1 Tax=Bacteroides caecigallinarum TaxID=1411144 RepID=UPI00195A9FFB|nr:DUF5627 domain-containing protein [Bacteroides caecigallinarum]MBM6865974.1 DUF1735 domain-containing protein [Bacteroides caecigallinarum]
MKKIYLTSMMLLALASCHNGDWHFDDYGTRSVYFAYQYPVRTITLGEDPSTDNTLDNQHKCKIMATTGGGYTNPDDITVYFEVDETLCHNIVFTGTKNPVKAMPQNYYTLSSNSEMVIPAGKLSGGVEVQLTDDFFNDEDAIKNTYVIPLRMTDLVGADTILSGKPLVDEPNVYNSDHWDITPKNYILYCIKYINPWHASYLRRGKDVIEGQPGHLSLSKEIVRHEKYVEEDEVMKLETKSMKEVTYRLYVEDESKQYHYYNVILTFDDDNNCSVSTDTQDCSITGEGKFVSKGDKNSWGNEDRDVIYLKYQATIKDLVKCTTYDTLVVRNRGVVMETFTPELQP